MGIFSKKEKASYARGINKGSGIKANSFLVGDIETSYMKEPDRRRFFSLLDSNERAAEEFAIEKCPNCVQKLHLKDIKFHNAKSKKK